MRRYENLVEYFKCLQKLEKEISLTSNLLVVTREKSFVFSMFFNFEEAHDYMKQLVTFAMRQSAIYYILFFLFGKN